MRHSNTLMEKVALTETQKSIWLESKLYEQAPIYMVGAYVKLNAYLEENRLKEAIAIVIEQNDVLRIGVSDEAAPSQFLKENTSLDLTIKDGLSESVANEWLKTHFKKNISLTDASLFQISLLKTDKGECFLVMKFHHIMIDGWSRGTLLRKIANQYNSLGIGQEAHEPSSFFDYAKNQSSDQGSKQRSLDFWMNKFQDYERFSLFKVKEAGLQFSPSARIEYELDRELLTRIKVEGIQDSKSKFYYTLAILYLTLSRTYGKKDIVFGVPLLNRSGEAQMNTVGCFINIIPLRLSFPANISLRKLIDGIVSEMRSTMTYRDVSIHQINQHLGVNFSNSTQLYDVVFSYENNDYDVQFGNAEVMDSGTISNDSIQTPLVLHYFNYHKEKPVKLAWDYNLNYFNESEARALIDRFTASFQFYSNDHDKLLSNAPVLFDHELKLIKGHSRSNRISDTKGLLYQIKKCVVQNDGKVAVRDSETEVTFSDLWQMGLAISERLAAKGASNGVPIAIMLPRSKDYLVSILGTLMSNAFYVPIDIEQPKNRVDAIFKDAAIKHVITTPELSNEFELNRFEVINVSEHLHNLTTLEPLDSDTADPAYAIFTSGSTGTPKGVLISKAGLLNLMQGLYEEVYQLYPSESKLALMSAFHFDASIQQIFACLLYGFELNLVPDKTRKDGKAFGQFLVEHRIDICDGVPSHLTALIKRSAQAPDGFRVKHFLVGGEKFSVNLLADLREWLGKQSLKISNLYGPTECTVDTTIHTVDLADSSEGGDMPIGHTLPGSEVYILDENDQLLPPNTEGEIHIGGNGVAIGYVNHEGIFNNKFYHHSVLKRRLYRTGDKGFLDDSGLFHFTGRKDNQVKLNGFRIELGEIESHLMDLDEVEQSLVALKTNGVQKSIVAFVVAKHPVTEEAVLKNLRDKVPSYMLPKKVAVMTEFPLTRTGKVDKNKLLERIEFNSIEQQKHNPPVNHIEKHIQTIFEETLGVEVNDVELGFFDLGGDSLSLVFLIAKIEEQFDKELQMIQFASNNSIREVAKLLTNDEQHSLSRIYYKEFEHLARGLTVTNSNLIHNPSKVAFLTGATGFVGVYLLERLVQRYDKVYCLIRSSSQSGAYLKLEKSLNTFGLNFPVDKVVLVNGDLNERRLGIKEDLWFSMKGEVDVVYHSGANVDFLASFDALKKPNTTATIDLLEFCGSIKQKRFNYISTKGVFTSIERELTENSDLAAEIHYREHGYKATKWVSDLIVQKARDLGLETNIFRLARITGDSRTGKVRPDDFFHRFMTGCLILKSFPRELLHREVDLTPVDITAQIIADFSESQLNSNFHVINHLQISYEQILKLCKQEGIKLKLLDYEDWLKDVNLLNAIDNQNPLFRITVLLKNKAWFLRMDIKFRNDQTLRSMGRHGLSWQSADKLWKSYLNDCLKNFKGQMNAFDREYAKHTM